MELAGRLGISASYLSQIEHGLVPEKPVLEAMLDTDDWPEAQRRDWLRAAGYAAEPTPNQVPPSPEQTADRVSEEYVTYRAEVTVRRDTGEIIQIKPLLPRGRKQP